ncbi:MAG TPA: Dyp-type peroxidase, partial [Nocardioides sp.]
PVGSVEPSRSNGVPQDTGEAYDLSPASLTVTLGLGPGLFDDRFGLAGRGPKLLAEIPRLPSDELKPELCGGDLALQACADDPQVAYHAIRDLVRIGRGLVTTRWTVLGFGRASAGKGQKTPRNLMGLKDGTRNIKTDDELDEFVWVTDPDEPAWMQGGSYLVTRKINMDIEVWDGTTIDTQHLTIGRDKAEGAPLSGKKEFDTPDFKAVRDGEPVIDPTSHVALAASENNGGAKMLRRGYNFTDGLNSLGQLDAGLFFIAFQKDPAIFVDLQRKLGRVDLLNEYIAHVGSAIFAVPRAPKTGHYLAEELFG